jgi:hypothetical protein
MHAELRQYQDDMRRFRNGDRASRPKPDINVMAYQVAWEISRPGRGRTFGKILPQIVADQDSLRADVLAYLIKRLHDRAQSCRRRGEHALQQALADAAHWDALVAQFRPDPVDVTDVTHVPRALPQPQGTPPMRRSGAPMPRGSDPPHAPQAPDRPL